MLLRVLRDRVGGSKYLGGIADRWLVNLLRRRLIAERCLVGVGEGEGRGPKFVIFIGNHATSPSLCDRGWDARFW